MIQFIQFLMFFIFLLPLYAAEPHAAFRRQKPNHQLQRRALFTARLTPRRVYAEERLLKFLIVNEQRFLAFCSDLEQEKRVLSPSFSVKNRTL
jgi:hypothetical protein